MQARYTNDDHNLTNTVAHVSDTFIYSGPVAHSWLLDFFYDKNERIFLTFSIEKLEDTIFQRKDLDYFEG